MWSKVFIGTGCLTVGFVIGVYAGSKATLEMVEEGLFDDYLDIARAKRAPNVRSTNFEFDEEEDDRPL